MTKLLVAAACAMGLAAQPAVRVVRTPPKTGANAFYAGNRAPLLPNPLIKLPPGSIRPEGWLRHQLELMAKGYSGHLEEISAFCKFEGNEWASPAGQGKFGWEEVPYWLRGYIDLGYVLQDPAIIREANRWVDAVLRTGRPNGYFGSESNVESERVMGLRAKMLDLWPNMVMLFPLRSLYEATGDKRILPFMTKYFRWQMTVPLEDFLPASWQKIRGGDNLDSIYWLYNRTGEPWLLDLARVTHERTADWAGGIASWHNVNFAECFREPAQYYQQTRDARYLNATVRNYDTMRRLYGQVPGGGYASDENSRPGFNGPRNGTETCGWVEMMFSHEMLTGITGDPLWADRAEDVAFNSFPASMTADLKGLHYITSPNQIQLDKANKAPMLDNDGDMFSYNPYQYRCCQHNSAFGWPYYSEYLWMATRDNGLAAVLYAPGVVKAKVGAGDEVRLTETTSYPFDEAVTIRVGAAKPVAFPLSLRVPGWCQRPAVSLNGKPLAVPASARGWLVLNRTWSEGDKLRLTLPMRIEAKTWPENGNTVSISRGPLSYSLKIGERWQRAGGTDAWPGYEVYATTPWNYGLSVNLDDPARSLRFVKNGEVPAQPFDANAAPVALKAKGRRIPQWKQEPNGMIGEVQPGPVRSNEPEEDITLIPMGCARLRISSFPRIANGPDAREWDGMAPVVEASSSGHYAPPSAAFDGLVPRNSADRGIPRFVWPEMGDRGGWIEYRYTEPRAIEAAEVYWADDGSGCALPQSWVVLYRSGSEWRRVEGADQFPVVKDGFSRVRFKRVETTAVRLQVMGQPKRTAGILEWTVR